MFVGLWADELSFFNYKYILLRMQACCVVSYVFNDHQLYNGIKIIGDFVENEAKFYHFHVLISKI